MCLAMFDLCKTIGYWRRQGDGFSYFMRGEEGRGGGGGPVPVFTGRDMFAFANSSITESCVSDYGGAQWCCTENDGFVSKFR